MYERFSDRARKTMQLANEAAMRLQHEYIATEHILLGLIKEGSGVAAQVLKEFDISLRMLRLDVEKLVQSGPDPVPIGARLLQTPRAVKVIEYAMEECRKLKHDHLGTEHLLLGLLRAEDGVAAQVLKRRGLNTEQVREEIVNLYGGRVGPAPVPEPRREIEDLPAELMASVAPLDAEIRSFKGDKEEAVANQEFEKAAYLRDQADKLHRRRRSLVREWFINRRIESSWLSANEGAALKLARSIGEQRSWDLLPKLADALEQAGCADADLIRHCRQPGTHSSQCWVIDLLLAKTGE